MNRMNFNQSVGFPFETNILDKMQSAFMLYNAFGAIVGNFTIISGCIVEGSNVSDGTVYINGELLEFRGGVIQENVRIIEEVEALEFEDTNSRDVIYTRYVKFGTASTNTFPWESFKRGLETKNIAGLLDDKANTTALTAIINLIATITTKLDTVEEGAEKNVQPNWNQTDNTKDDFIKNKPVTISALYKSTYVVGDADGSDSMQTVTFPSVGTNNYMVLGTLVSNGGNFDNDNDVIWMVRDKQNASFKLTLREVSGQRQNLSFDYILIPL